MAIKRNAGRVAATVQPSQKVIALPTWQQTMLTALDCARSLLEQLDAAIARDKDWGVSEVDVDVCYAMELVLERIKRMRTNPPTERGMFEIEWYAAASVVNLSVRAFTRPDAYYFRLLESVQKMFEVFGTAVELVDLKRGHHGNTAQSGRV